MWPHESHWNAEPLQQGQQGTSRKGIKTLPSRGLLLSATATWQSCSHAGETLQWWRHEEQHSDFLQTQHLCTRRWERKSWRLQPVEWTCILGPFSGWLTYQLFTRLLLHSSRDIKGEKRFLLLCLPGSDLTITVQAVVELIHQVHSHCRKQPL